MSIERSFVAYEIENAITGARYIGITTRSLKQRWADHCSKTNNNVLGRAIKKYGKESFHLRPLAEAVCFPDLLELEKILIAQEKTRTFFGGYNMTDGGDGTLGIVFSDARRKRHSEMSKKAMTQERKKYLSECAIKQFSSPEAREFISRTNSGRIPTEETRRKLSIAGKARPPRSKETCLKLSAALKGRPRPPEVRAKVSASKMGKKMSLEARLNMSRAGKGRPKSETMRAKLRAYHARKREERMEIQCA